MIGQYKIVRSGWRCNLCGHMTYTDKITHKCGKAPHFMSHEEIAIIPRAKLKSVLVLIKSGKPKQSSARG